MNTANLKKEYNKISKRYYKLEENDFRNYNEENEINNIEIRMSEIAKILEELED